MRSTATMVRRRRLAWKALPLVAFAITTILVLGIGARTTVPASSRADPAAQHTHTPPSRPGMAAVEHETAPASSRVDPAAQHTHTPPSRPGMAAVDFETAPQRAEASTGGSEIWEQGRHRPVQSKELPAPPAEPSASEPITSMPLFGDEPFSSAQPRVRADNRCGPDYPVWSAATNGGVESLCRADDPTGYCCSPSGNCGNSEAHCSCGADCTDSRLWMVGECSTDIKSDTNVDLIYLWVNTSDPAFQAQYDEHEIPKKDSFWNAALNQRDDMALKWSLRSVQQSGLWKNVRKVFIVYNSIHAPPAFLNLSHPQLVLVPHKDIMPRASLPTFNSLAIFFSLTNIRGLSDWFYLMDDDYFFGSSCPPLAVQAFTNWGTSNLRQTGVLQPGLPGINVDAYFKYQNNSNNALNRIFGDEKIPGDRIAETHRPYLLNFCTIQRAQQLLIPSERHATMWSRHRNPKSDLTLHFFYAGFLSSLGLMKDVLLTDDPDTEVTDGSVISAIYSEIHGPPTNARPELELQLHSKLVASLSKIEAINPCYLNIQGYPKGGPAAVAVTAFYKRNYPVASPIEA